MKNKKLLWVLLLIAFLAIIILIITYVKPKSSDNKNQNTDTFQKNTNILNVENSSATSSNKEDSNFERLTLDDGILYALNGKKVTADIVVGTNYFDTTISDMYLNYDSYKGKVIEIEGMYLDSNPYTFIGRYSTSNLCPYCPAGYSYMEFQIDCDIKEKFEDEKTWLKVVGTLQKGNDETSNFQDYYYLQLSNLEIMNHRGEDTVTN